MSVVNGQVADAATFNAAFGSKQDDNTYLGIQTLSSALSGPVINDVQQTVNNHQADIDDLWLEITNHEADLANPHVVTKAQVGLGSADNTSDLNKPISTATQAALDAKASIDDAIVNALIFG